MFHVMRSCFPLPDHGFVYLFILIRYDTYILSYVYDNDMCNNSRYIPPVLSCVREVNEVMLQKLQIFSLPSIQSSSSVQRVSSGSSLDGA